ncbi:23S rRNA (adenine(2030)-N(6))-methyltransferase RlmJ [Aliidiomarina halalkaliphila]|uniref:23S rRNA (adenine(2030)-N(6))-methyltransferase RlmJ n=1 Tax=Aliidiomarina halalkaliphila TaxID=2593535 RepID=UPI00163DC81A|nr:23S rRNA (adenine(2030)-N(6))-methyltransferase RlmJ [Aliidiomarina halalkaliphila]
MLSYQHGYHAGNPADVHKHLTLLAVIRRLQEKPSAIHFFDTHAGRGWYDLRGPQAQKNGEFREGVGRVLAARDALTNSSQGDLWSQFFSVLANAHATPPVVSDLQFYPGSPAWVASQRRENDRHTVFELHPTEHDELTQIGKRRTGFVVYGDGLHGLIKNLPPKTPRLLVLIDPAYEVKDEYADVSATVGRALKQCRHGVVLVWYPLLPAARHEAMLSDLQQLATPCIRSEFHYKKQSDQRGMYGSGMLIFNPPWQLDTVLHEAFAPVQSLYEPAATHHVDWLNAEV